MNQERHGNCWVTRGAIFDFFAFCCFLHYWRVVILTALQAAIVVYFLCCGCSSECTDWFQWIFLVERGTGRNEHGVVVVWISARVCVFSLSVFFAVVCTIFVCAVFLWAPEHLCDHGLDLWDQLMWEFNSIKKFKNVAKNRLINHPRRRTPHKVQELLD